jgi:hypothetical protein
MLMRSIASLIGSALLAGCSVVGVRTGTEQPKYEVVERLNDGVEVRRYGERLAAEVTVNRGRRGSNENAAFGALAGYIFGKNEARVDIDMTSPVETSSRRPENRSEKIAMTSPVATTSTGGAMTMRFFLPASYTLDTVPVPLNSNISIVPVPFETIAALKFSGMRSSANVAIQTAALLKHLDETDWTPAAAPVAYFYDPPWTLPALRRNEIVVKVEKRGG